MTTEIPILDARGLRQFGLTTGAIVAILYRCGNSAFTGTAVASLALDYFRGIEYLGPTRTGKPESYVSGMDAHRPCSQ